MKSPRHRVLLPAGVNFEMLQEADMAHRKGDGIGMTGTLALFGGAGALLWLGTRVLIPRLEDATGVEPVLLWFLVGGLGVFAPLLVVAGAILLSEGWRDVGSLWRSRLRFRKLTREDWIWAVGCVAVVGILSYTLIELLEMLSGSFDPNPRFMRLEPLRGDRLWILAAWLPFWGLNIMAEEVLWRGVVLPRQESSFGRHAWLVNAGGWMLFHIAFGWRLMVVLLPIVLVVPYVVQRKRSSWLGVVVHAGLNGPGFIAVALGAA